MLAGPVEQILQPGGQMVMATLGDRAIGCCALLPMAEGGFEIAKMAVAEDCRGSAVGKNCWLMLSPTPGCWARADSMEMLL